MRNVVIPVLVLLPSLGGIALAALDAGPWGYAPRAEEQRELTAREASVSYSGGAVTPDLIRGPSS